MLTPTTSASPSRAGRLQQLHVAGVQQIEHAVGEDDRARLRLAARRRRRPRANLAGRSLTLGPLPAGTAANSAFSAGGAMNVVTMTMRSTAPNTSSPRTPDRRPMSAKMRPTSPRGTIPTPTTRRRNADPRRGPPGGQLADHREHDEHPGDERASRARLRGGRVEQAEVDRRADAHEEDRREDRSDRPHLLLDGVELVGARQDEAGGEGADDERRPGQRGQRREAEREGDGGDQQHVANPHADDRRRRAGARGSGRPSPRPPGTRPRPRGCARCRAG